MYILTILFFLLGITLTSFYQLVAQRVPIKKSILGRSECDNCNKSLRFVDVLPLIGYVVNLGKCHHCKTKISIKYPIIEIIGGLLFSFSYYMLGLSLDLIIAIVLISVLMIESLSDSFHRIVIDTVWLVGLIIIIPIRIIQETFLTHLLSATVLFAFLWIFAYLGSKILKKTALGGGDIKLYFFIGFALTIWPNMLSLFLASVIALLYMLVFKKTKGYIPLVPFIAVSVMINFFYGNQIIEWYLNLFGM